jgi:AcrR family transcriptional regulator
MKTKDRILNGALILFNTHGATEVTTNDIARELKMSPGNLYFHYKNKEQIIRELFKKLSQETIKVWKPQARQAKARQAVHLIEFVDKNLVLYWMYRFFHRETYILRKKDPELSKLWRRHIKRMGLLMNILYKHWVKAGYMMPIQSKAEIEFVGELLFVASSSFMQFFETGVRAPELKPRTAAKARHHLIRMLLPYLSEATRVQIKDEFENILKP